MKLPRRTRRRPFAPNQSPLTSSAIDQHEVARFLRHQPPLEIPARHPSTSLVGLIGLSVLGYRIIRRLD